MIPRFLHRLAAQWCIDCEGVMWPGQPRCFGRHSACKHAGDARIAMRSGLTRWKCDACGR